MARRQKKYHFIYKTTNLLSGKYYYGMHSTDNMEDGYLGSGKRLRYSLNKYGRENHKREVVEFCNSREKLKEREKEIVNLNEIAKKDCMNLMVGGKGGFISVEQQRERSRLGGERHSELLKSDKDYRTRHSEKLSKALSGKNNPMYGKPSPNGFKGKSHTADSKRKISEANKGKGKGVNNSVYGTCWVYSLTECKNKRIKKVDLEKYENSGWTKGRRPEYY